MKKIIFLLFLSLALLGEKVVAQPKSGGTEFFAGYNSTAFQNATFAQNLGSSRLSGGAGWMAGLRMHFGFEKAGPKIVVINLNYFASSFKVNDANNSFNGKTIAHTGGEVGLSLMLLPKALPYFSPFLGVGYQGGGLKEAKDSNTTTGTTRPTSTATSTDASLGMSAPLWKMGVHFQIKQVILQAEYKQTFGGEAERKFSQFCVTLGWQPWQFN